MSLTISPPLQFALISQISGTGAPQIIVRFYGAAGSLKTTTTIATGTGARVSTDITGLNVSE